MRDDDNQDLWVPLGAIPCVPDPKQIGQGSRCSVLDISTQTLPQGTTRIGVTTDAPVSFDIAQDVFGPDPTVWTGLENGATRPVEARANLYIANPDGAQGVFEVQLSAVVPADTPFPQESWMGSASLDDIALNDLALPGAHDAGSFGIGRSSPKGADANPALPATPGSLGIIDLTPTARAQGRSWTQQLLAGVRYFDIRLTPFSGVDGQLGGTQLTHSWIGQSQDAMLAEIADFLSEHPTELTLLDFQHLYGFSDADHEATAAAIEAAFGGMLAPSAGFGPTSTLGALLGAGHQVVAVYQDDDPQNGTDPPPGFFQEHPGLWPRSETLVSVWGNQSTVKGLLAFLDTQIDEKPADKLWVLQAQLTTPWSEGLDLQDAAAQSNPAIVSWLESGVPDDPVNVVMVDWTNLGGVPDSVISRNG